MGTVVIVIVGIQSIVKQVVFKQQIKDGKFSILKYYNFAR